MKPTIPAQTALRFVAVLGLLLSLSACSGSSLDQAKLQPRVTRLIAKPKETVAGETLLQRDAVIAFYQDRKFKPAWDLGPGAASIREAIAGIGQDGLDPDEYHLARIDSLLARRKVQRTDERDAELEILFSDAVAGMIDHARYGRVLPASLDKHWNVDPRKDAPPIAEAMARVAESVSPAAGLEKEKLDHFIYVGLKGELDRLTTVAKQGGWAAIPAGRTLEPGARDPRIALVRARLGATGELPKGTAADSVLYDADLATAVQGFQDRHRLTADGRLDVGALAAMNVSVEDRIDQVKVNLERSRWVLPGLTADFVLVNLPAFKAYLIRDGKAAWESRTQIGKEARQTPIFRADMKQVIFNPTWTVPPTILAEDVLGGIARGEDMLARKKLKVYDGDGKLVDPKSVDWKSATAENFPYTLRQDAGPDNALGRVKFMLPNQYDIYLHDTPSRELFASEERTFSSGCIRLEDPIGFAKVLLADQGYDDAKINEVIATGETKAVDLTTPLPVLIVYWTVSVGASGEVRYGPDVYDRDGMILAALSARRGLVAPRAAGI